MPAQRWLLLPDANNLSPSTTRSVRTECCLAIIYRLERKEKLLEDNKRKIVKGFFFFHYTDISLYSIGIGHTSLNNVTSHHTPSTKENVIILRHTIDRQFLEAEEKYNNTPDLSKTICFTHF